jgi:hypothetical protein
VDTPCCIITKRNKRLMSICINKQCWWEYCTCKTASSTYDTVIGFDKYEKNNNLPLKGWFTRLFERQVVFSSNIFPHPGPLFHTLKRLHLQLQIGWDILIWLDSVVSMTLLMWKITQVFLVWTEESSCPQNNLQIGAPTRSSSYGTPPLSYSRTLQNFITFYTLLLQTRSYFTKQPGVTGESIDFSTIPKTLLPPSDFTDSSTIVIVNDDTSLITPKLS